MSSHRAITAFLVEDEAPALRRLQGFLTQIPDIEVIGTASEGIAAGTAIEAARPDLLFLDIKLPDISGIDLLHLLRWKPQVIFTTAYDQYAVQAFELQAIDYLLKPFSEERLGEAVSKARAKLANQETASESLREFLAQWNPQQEYLRRIPSRVGDKIYILADEEVVYFASEHKLVYAYQKEAKFILNYTLDQLQSRLDPERFFRIHRSTIVNLNFVKTIEAWYGGGYRMKVKDGRSTELNISRSAGKLLREKLGW